MRTKYILAMILALITALALASCAYPLGTPGYGQPYPNYGPGGMMGGGGMGPGMMGGNYGNYNRNPNTQPITIEQAAEAARLYLNPYGDRLVLAEVMNFAQNYYAEVEEEDTGIHAMELLIDKYTGQVYPEYGPNMMWNTKYGMMSGGMMSNYRGTPTANMPVSPEQAQTVAHQYLNANIPGLTIAEADTFYGYYTLHTLKDGQVQGMISVNGYTGAVWYHTWHGSFIGMLES